MVKVMLSPEFTLIFPLGSILPPVPAVAVIVWVSGRGK